MTDKEYEARIANLEAEISLMQGKVDFANKTSEEAITHFFEQQRKINELRRQLVEYEAKGAKDIAKAVKDAKFEAEKEAVERCCDVFDDCIGFHAYEYTDRIRKMYKLPTKYGY